MAQTLENLTADLRTMGVPDGGTLMVHASLSALGHVQGGASTVVAALLAAIGPKGTVVMPTFRESKSVEGLVDTVPPDLLQAALATTPPYDPASTPSEMGAITEAFRTWPGAQRSAHPTSSVAARGPLAEEITERHPIAWATGSESPFQVLQDVNAHFLLLGVGFNRLTMLHYAETLLPKGRRKTRLVPVDGKVQLFPDTGDDLNTHFPGIGEAALAEGAAQAGMVGQAQSFLMRAKPIVAVAQTYLSQRLD